MAESAQASPLVLHREAVRGFVLRLVGDAALADDLTQETFVRAARANSPLPRPGAERGWLCTVALNLARDHFRALSRRREEVAGQGAAAQCAPEDDPELQAMRNEMSTCIAEFLIRLPAPRRDVVALHDMGGLSHHEIAAALGISEANSRVLLHRGRAALRGELERGCVLSFDGDPVPCERKPTV